jgi:hypothetical protein
VTKVERNFELRKKGERFNKVQKGSKVERRRRKVQKLKEVQKGSKGSRVQRGLRVEGFGGMESAG